MSAPTPIPPNIQEIAAAQLLGAVWNWCLYGALVVQFYVYSYNFPRDNKYLKLFVYSIFFWETLQVALCGADLYYWFAAGFGNMDRLVTPYASPFDAPIMGSAVSLCVQFFFVYRIWVLSKKRVWWLCVIICVSSITDAVAAFMGGIYAHVHGKFAEGVTLKVLALTWVIGNTVSDVLIASAMLYHLTKLKARENFSSHALVRIVRLTIETNLVTTTVSIVALIMVAVYPTKNWYLCPTYIIGKVYSNTLLVSLNNRISIRDTRGAVDYQVAAFPSSDSGSEATSDVIVMSTEKRQQQFMKPPLPLGEPGRVVIHSVVDIA